MHGKTSVIHCWSAAWTVLPGCLAAIPSGINRLGTGLLQECVDRLAKQGQQALSLS